MITFLSVIGLILVALYLIAAYKTKSFKPALDAGALKGIILATIFVVVSGLFFDKAYATEWSIINYTTVFAGVDQTKKVSPMCKEGGLDDRLTSNIGINQNLVTINGVDVNLQYTHHSCALGKDAKGYDAVGIKAEWTFGRKR